MSVLGQLQSVSLPTLVWVIKAGHSFDLCGFATRAMIKKSLLARLKGKFKDSRGLLSVSVTDAAQRPWEAGREATKKDLYLRDWSGETERKQRGAGCVPACLVQTRGHPQGVVPGSCPLSC